MNHAGQFGNTRWVTGSIERIVVARCRRFAQIATTSNCLQFVSRLHCASADHASSNPPQLVHAACAAPEKMSMSILRNLCMQFSRRRVELS